MKTTYDELIKLFHLKNERQIKAGLANKITLDVTVTDYKLEELITKFRTTKVLTIDDVSKRFKISKTKLIELVKQGVVSSYQLTSNNGSKYLFFESDIENEQEVEFVISYQKKQVGNKLSSPDLLREIIQSQSLLTRSESLYIKYLYLDLLTVKEIAKKYNTSEYFVNQVITEGKRKLIDVVNHEKDDYRQKYLDLEAQHIAVCAKFQKLKDKKEYNALTTDELMPFDKILDSQITDLNLSNRALHGLDYEGVETIRDLVKIKKRDILKYKYLGYKTVKEIELFLKRYGLKFGMEL
jgi:predicted DNA-binding protein YlxM (UPF0122 family)